MTRYLIDPEPEDTPDAPITWTCLEPECGQTVTDLDAHTRGHGSEVVEVFTSQHALDLKLAEEARAAEAKAWDGVERRKST